MGVFYGNFNPDATFTSDIGSITRLATSAPFGRYLQEEIFQQSAFYTSGILAADARLNNTIGTRVELPFFAPLNYIEERVDSSDTWGLNQVRLLHQPEDEGFHAVRHYHHPWCNVCRRRSSHLPNR